MQSRRRMELENFLPPLEWDKFLFAEDLVSYFMRKLLWNKTPFGETDVAPKSGCCRHFVRNCLNEYVRRAVDIIQTTLDYRIRQRFAEIAQKHGISDVTFVQQARYAQKVYLSGGNNDPIQFLKFCVSLSVLAVHFYKISYKNAPDTATSFIFKAFPVKTMSTVTWDALEMVSKSYVIKYENEYAASDLNEIQSSVSENKPCDCFLLVVSGRTFREVFKNRERQLTCHFKECLGIDNPSEALASITAPMPETPKQSTGVSDFLHTLTEPQSKDCNIALTDPILSFRKKTQLLGCSLLAELFGTDMGIDHYELTAEEGILSAEIRESLQMYGEKTEKLFGSQSALQVNKVPAASSECNSSDGHEHMSSAYDPLQVYREKMERFFGSQIQFQRDENPTAFPRTTLDLEHRRASSARNASQTGSEKSQDFFVPQVELPEHGNFEMVPRNMSDNGHGQTLTTHIVNNNYVMRPLQDVQMQRSRCGLFDCTEYNSNTDAITVQGHGKDFRFQYENFSEQNESTSVSNATPIPASPNLRVPNINYNFFLVASPNVHTQYRGEEAIGFSGISKPESTASQKTETLSIKSHEVHESINNLNAQSRSVADMIENLTIQDVSDASSDKDVKPPNFKI